MNLEQFDKYIRDLLPMGEWDNLDIGLNGIQVGGKKREITRIACAVDACVEVFLRAAQWKADLVFVHHGLFWGRVLPITGPLYKRIDTLIRNNIALYAAHLPLDMDPTVGNNAALADMLSLKDLQPFGSFKGKKIGFKGILPKEKTLTSIISTLGLSEQNGLSVLPFGPAKIRSVGIISGSACHEIDQAISENLDLYITGEASHEIFHTAEEAEISVLCGGHYQTEIWGVQRVAKSIEKDCGIETCFIDLPTGL